MKLKSFVVALLVLMIASVAQAQTGPCPTGSALTVIPTGGTINACLSPNLDTTSGHNALDSQNRPVVIRYEVLLFNDGDPVTATPQATINIGKPTLNAQSVGWVVLPNAQVPQNRRLRSSVVAVGQNDSGGSPMVSPRSALSANPFVVGPVSVTPAAPGSLVVP